MKTVREAVPFVLYVFLAFSTNCLDFFSVCTWQRCLSCSVCQTVSVPMLVLLLLCGFFSSYHK